MSWGGGPWEMGPWTQQPGSWSSLGSTVPSPPWTGQSLVAGTPMQMQEYPAVPPGGYPGFPAGPPGAPMLPIPATPSWDIGAAMDPDLAHRAWMQQSGFFPPGIQSLGMGEPMWHKSAGLGGKIASQLQGAFQKVLDRWSHSGVPGAQWNESSRSGSRDRSPAPQGAVPLVKGDPMFLAQSAPQSSPWPGAPLSLIHI